MLRVGVFFPCIACSGHNPVTRICIVFVHSCALKDREVVLYATELSMTAGRLNNRPVTRLHKRALGDCQCHISWPWPLHGGLQLKFAAARDT